MSEAIAQANLSKRTSAAIADLVAGRARTNPFNALLFAGPAVVASIAYMDPGNFATNIAAGSKYGYALLWVVLVANLLAMMFQALSAKLGLVTGRNLAEHCRDAFPKPVVYAMWAVSEGAAMATDLAEFLGGAIGLALLFHLPILVGMTITAILTYVILLLDRGGYRPMELLIGALVAVIALCYVAEMFIAPVDWAQAAWHIVTPSLPGGDALLISVGIVGATVMPHAVYLHSGLMQDRVRPEDVAGCRRLLKFSNREVIVALAVAGLVNMAMVIMAAAAFHKTHSGVAEIDTAYKVLTPLLGAGAASVFLVSLIASGISSSVVGTMAGQMIMQGFVGFQIPIWLRRLVTMAPAFVVVAIGVNPAQALIVSQVVLSFALPVPMIALVLFTRRRDLMGEFVNSRPMALASIVGATIVVALNLVLLLQTFGVSLPGVPAG